MLTKGYIAENNLGNKITGNISKLFRESLGFKSNDLYNYVTYDKFGFEKTFNSKDVPQDAIFSCKSINILEGYQDLDKLVESAFIFSNEKDEYKEYQTLRKTMSAEKAIDEMDHLQYIIEAVYIALNEPNFIRETELKFYKSID